MLSRLENRFAFASASSNCHCDKPPRRSFCLSAISKPCSIIHLESVARRRSSYEIVSFLAPHQESNTLPDGDLSSFASSVKFPPAEQHEPDTQRPRAIVESYASMSLHIYSGLLLRIPDNRTGIVSSISCIPASL